MPHILKTIVPRIRRSIRDRGVMSSFCRSFLLPAHLWREYRAAKSLSRHRRRSEFDLASGTDIDGEIDDWTYLSDLDIPSRNWIEGTNYAPIEPERFNAILSELNLPLAKLTFIDYGSGKGRALLLASHFPFHKIIGLEFSPELHAVAQSNIRAYTSPNQICKVLQSECVDFVDYQLPTEPCLLYFFDPCSEKLLSAVLERVRPSYEQFPRPIYLVYVAPGRKELLLDKTDFLTKLGRSDEYQFSWYVCK